MTAVDVQLRDPISDEPSGVASFADAMRIVFSDSRLQQSIDVLALIDLRRKCLEAKAGQVLALSDEEWAALVALLRRPLTLAPVFVHSAEAFFRAFFEAPTTPVAALAAQ